MLENFKSYINTLLCLGIFIKILQLIIPKNKSRKYIYSLTGIIMIITVISPIVNLLKNEKIEAGINQVLSNIDSYKIDENVGKVHWVAISKSEQGNKLAKPLLSKVLFRLKELNHKITVFDVKGGVFERKRKIILSVIPSREYYRVTEVIKEIDKDAFFIVTDSYEVNGAK